MEGGGQVNALILNVANVYFNENIAVHEGNAIFDGFRVFNRFGPGAPSSFGICGCVVFRVDDTYFESERLFVKHFCSSAAVTRQQAHDDSLYLNVEMHFHRRVVPLFDQMRRIDHLVPKFYAGCAESTATYDAGAIVFQNVNQFRNFGYSRFLDQQLLLLALRKIAEFHAYSFQARRCNQDFGPSVSHRIHTEHMEKVVNTLHHCLQPLVQAGEFAGWVPRLCNLIDNLEFRIEQQLRQRDNDGCVLCHRNYSQVNILFHFDDQKKMATDLRIVNWQWMGFASLGVDLVILLFVETHPQTLREHWKQLLQEYSRSLYATFEDPSVPDYERVYTELKASVPIALYMLGLRANRLHLRTTSQAAINMSSLLWNERLITDVFKELIRRDLV